MDSRSAEQLPQKELSIKISGKSEADFKHPQRDEDAIAFDEKAGFAMVLDGMGGLDDGDRASQAARDVIVKCIVRVKDDTDPGKVEQEIARSFNEASDQVKKKVPRSGTTAVAVKIVGVGKKVAIVASVGDSRVYIFRDGQLRQITEDDSSIPLGLRGKFDETDGNDLDLRKEYEIFSRRNEIMQYLGSGKRLNVHLYQENLKGGDKIILTSDGVHDNLRTSEIEEIAGSEDVANSLVSKAFVRSKDNWLRSKPDDISAVVMEVN